MKIFYSRGSMAQVDTFNSFVQKQLNPAQQEAVTHGKGPILVIAGAGSGKTRIITARITNLILNHHIPPQTIVALTFTNKAANEMKERITHFLGTSNNLPFIGTFHAYCVRLLKQNSHHHKMPAFTILDSDDQSKMVSSILHRANAHKNMTPRNAIYQISHIKNQLISPINSNLFTHPIMEQVYHAYEKEKKLSNCFDFDDLMLEVLKLFNTNNVFKTMHHQHVPHLLVDEYQDTNVVQHELLKQMALHNNNLAIDSLCAVGDEDQSIYSWRGATIANMLNFKKDFADTAIIKIEQNYRSVQPILEVANKVIEKNVNRNPKKLWSDKKATDRVRITTCMSEYQEGECIAQCLKAAKKYQQGSSIAVLYRTHVQSRAIEEALIKHSIPYKIIGGIQFYERKEIKDLFAYLRLIINPFDRTSFFRIINTPSRGFGDKFDELFYTHWNDEPFLTFAQIARKLIDDGILKGIKRLALEQFISLFNDVESITLPSKALDIIIRKIKYVEYLKEAYEPQEAQERVDNIQELIDAIRYFESNGIDTIELLLHEVALMQEKMQKQDDQQDKVLLMSLHAAKGLEFDMVILAGLEEGIMPTVRALSNDDAIEEERRLFYVGITRAKERLLLTHTKYRYTYGKMVDQISSRFLDEVPTNIASRHDNSSSNSVQLHTFFSSWIGAKNHHLSNQDSVMTFGTAKQSDTHISPHDTQDAQENHMYTAYTRPTPVSHQKTPYGQHSSTTRIPQTKNTYTHTTKPSLSQRPSNYQSPLRSSQTKPATPSCDTSSSHNSVWRKNKPVKHAKYGLGLVEKTEEKNGDIYVTVKFKTGIKKIVSGFLESI